MKSKIPYQFHDFFFNLQDNDQSNEESSNGSTTSIVTATNPFIGKKTNKAHFLSFSTNFFAPFLDDF